jgi:hypothetical protein
MDFYLEFVFDTDDTEDDDYEPKRVWIKKLKCTDEQYSDIIQQPDVCKKIAKLEDKYGTLDGEGEETENGWINGFSSCEVDEDEVEELVEEFRKIFKSYNIIGV